MELTDKQRADIAANSLDTGQLLDAAFALGVSAAVRADGVKPGRKALIRAIKQAMSDAWTDADEYHHAPKFIAKAVIALLPGRTEAEVLREAAYAMPIETLEGADGASVWLSRRADEIARGGE